MTNLVRRDVLKTGGVTALATILPAVPIGAAGTGSASLREIVSLATGWRFHLGHASDPAKDFGFGRSHDTYAKSGDVGTPVAEPKFDASAWTAVTLPHD